MYILNWNPNEQRIEASFGGVITAGEGEVFLEDLRDLLKERQATRFTVLLDLATARQLDVEAKGSFLEARDVCLFAGADSVYFVLRDEMEAARLTESRLQSVLEGRERYAVGSLAA
ncbi:MAG: hypothetical protein KIT11_09680 [Fimbriimonadaceae bacterium]|nr:hypothetical protein [Fimbriimonadaceae bacterium]QYK55595.1 MAG: hypothetical protein KF733_11350 [Fimbriimonadaceae bacterium]